ncbi:elongation of very long chain fatty acids protein AAEL008004-like [Panonychus citri]|uniref:elongation of very long chain fatty acids protein AAEL008004-like n=1 Tax=Panonychus citri TaxID=50023 RepID=UPI002307F7A9|nr:elongation of very long chain fatty acids protein AAEL008004-like [Panonychus citri]
MVVNGSEMSKLNLDYIVNGFWYEYGDPRTFSMPIIGGGPWKVFTIVFGYLLFVKVFGPIYMKNRQPFDLREIMLLHNSFLIGINGVGTFVGLWVTDWGSKTFDCSPPETEDVYNIKVSILIWLGWIYFMTKIVDFSDTIFFVLRRKNHQASFLHIFHHGSMPLVAYFGLKFHPGPYSAFLPIFNCFIHFIMYIYYAMACAGPSMKKFLWWKKQLTQIQIVQFMATIVHASYAFFTDGCHYPKLLSFLEGMHATIFLVMFLKFYFKTYSRIPNKLM